MFARVPVDQGVRHDIEIRLDAVKRLSQGRDASAIGVADEDQLASLEEVAKLGDIRRDAVEYGHGGARRRTGPRRAAMKLSNPDGYVPCYRIAR